MALMCSASPSKSLSLASTSMTTEESSVVIAVSARVTAALFWSSRIVTPPANSRASTCFRLSMPSRVRDEVGDRHLVVAGALRGDVVFEERARIDRGVEALAAVDVVVAGAALQHFALVRLSTS